MACVAAHLHIKIEKEWMTALQATKRGHGLLLQDLTHSQLLSLRLHEGGNVFINTSLSEDEAPIPTGVATTGYQPDLSSEPKSDRFITYPLHEGLAGERRAALFKPSYCDVTRNRPKEGQERLSPLDLDPNSLRVIKEPKRAQRINTEEPREVVKGSTSTLPGGHSAGQQLGEKNPGVVPDARVDLLSSIISQSLPKPILTPQISTSEIPDIHLRTPDGNAVSELEAQWELNPYAQECGDTSGLLGLKPGHYQLKGNMEAHDLYSLAQSDFYSQFFQTRPTGEPETGLEPPFSLGKAKVLHNQRRSASRLRVLSTTAQAKRVDTRSTAITPSLTLSQQRESIRARNDIFIKSDPIQKPTLEEIGISVRDKELLHPDPTEQNPKRGLTSRERKRPRSRKSDMRLEHGWTSNIVAPEEPNPEKNEKFKVGKKSSQSLNPAGYRRLDLPTQQIDPVLEEPGTETGAACFGPQTLLLVQNPMNQVTYDSGKSLTRPIERIGHGSTVLAEKQDRKGRSTFFLSKVACLMIFEIPQDGDPEANMFLQKKILSKGLGFPPTKHHHVRKYGHIHEQASGGRHVLAPAHTTKWCEAADLDEMDQKTTTFRSDIPLTIVTRVFNLVLDPPGNVVILAHRDELYSDPGISYAV